MSWARKRGVAIGTLAAIAATGCTPAESGHFDGVEPAEIVEEAWRAMRALDYVRIDFETSSPDSGWRLDSEFGPLGECRGEAALRQGGAEVTMEYLGLDDQLYIQGDQRLWAEIAPGAAEGDRGDLTGKWVAFPMDEGPFGGICDVADLLETLSEPDRHQSWEREDRTRRVNRTHAVVLRASTDSDDPQQAHHDERELYVADTRDAHVLEAHATRMLEDGQQETAEVVFSAFDEEFTLSEPAADDTVDGQELLQAAAE